jgi:hypothetical protein
MRIKELRRIVTFHTTTEAMAFEEAAKEAGLDGRLIPVPPAMTAGCGIAWSGNPDSAAALMQMIGDRELSYDRTRELVV